MIRDHYYQKRAKDTPVLRDVTIYWHVGETGTGKSYERIKKIEEFGEDEVYVVSDYKNGFDQYGGQKVIFLEEFRGQMPYNLLLMILDKYKVQIPARYSNVLSLWQEVHITTPKPLERVYKDMVDGDRNLDTLDQLKRRIDFVVYHYKDGDEYCKIEYPMSEYTSYDVIKALYADPLPL